MRHCVLTPLACLATIYAPIGVQAQPSAPAAIETPLDADGVSAIGKLTPNDCLVGSDVNLQTMLAKTAELQSNGAIRSDVDRAHVKARAWTTASSVLLNLQPFLMDAVFRGHSEIDKCGFVTTITGSNGKPESAFGFAITRAMYDKIDWSSASQQDLPNVTNDFTLGRVTAGHMKAESE